MNDRIQNLSIPAWIEVSCQHPLRVLAAAALLFLAALPGLFRLELRTDGHALVPAKAPEVLADEALRARFGVLDPLVIVLHSSDPRGIFYPEFLDHLTKLTHTLKAQPELDPDHVSSLASEKSFRFRAGSLKLRGLLEPLPKTPEQLAQLRDDLDRIGIYHGVLVAEDRSAASILIGTPPGIDRVALYHRLVALVEAQQPPLAQPIEIDILGAPVAEALLGHHTLADLGVPVAWLHLKDVRPRFIGMVPLALLVMSGLLMLAFRRLAAVLLTLALVGYCLILTFGLMGWLGVPIYLTTAVLPVILTAMGVADGIHLMRRFQERFRDQPQTASEGLAADACAELRAPIVQTSITTGLGFLSFTISPLVPVQTFGVFTAIGIAFLMIGSLSLMPAMMVLCPSGWLVRQQTQHTAAARWMERWAAWVLRRRTAVLFGALIAILIGLDGVRQVRVHDSWLDGFSPQSGFARATDRFERLFLGAHQLFIAIDFESWRAAGEVSGAQIDHREVMLTTEPSMDLPSEKPRLAGSWIRLTERHPQPGRDAPRNWQSSILEARSEETEKGRHLHLTLPPGVGSPRFWLDPKPDQDLDFELWSEALTVPFNIEHFRDLEAFLDQRPEVGGTLGPSRYLLTTAFMMAPDKPEAWHLPERPREARTLWHNYRTVRGPQRAAQLVTPDANAGLITTFLRGSDYSKTRALLDALQDYETTHLRPQGARLELGGDVAVSQALIRAVVRTQTGSLLLSLIGILVVASLAGRSVRLGLLCVVPSALAVWFDFALMGWLRIPLGVATSMFAGMTLGVGVDYAIHLLHRAEEAGRTGLDRAAAITVALRDIGPAIMINALAVGVGFGVLTFSQVPGNARLGALLSLSVGLCLVATLLLIPAGSMLRWGAGRPDRG